MINAVSHTEFDKRAMPIEAILLAHQLVLLPLYFFVPVWIAVINTIAAGAVFYCSRNPHVVINRWLKVAVTLVAIAGVLVAFRKFSGRDAGVALIAVMYGLKILEIRTRRDANLILSLSFFILIAGFFFSQKPIIAFYQFIPVIAVLNGFIAMQSLQKFELASSTLKSVLKDLSRYLLIAIPIMIVLFVFFPRLSGPLWRMPGASLATTGVSDVMSFSEISALQTSDNIAFRVTFNGAAPEETELYWRVLVLDTFDGIAWQRSRRNPMADLDVTLQSGTFDYSVTLEPTKLNYLVTLDRPLNSPQNAVIVNDQTVFSRFRVLDRTRYQLTSSPSLIIDSVLPASQRQLYLNLPSTGNSDSIEWAEDLRETVNSDAEFVNQVLRVINQQEYFYTLTPGEMDEEIIDSFWLDKREGFCEHYASTLVFLARAAGIPARVVVGYQGAEKNPLADYWIVRDANAHAWTEIWLEGRGWVRFDPTAAIASHRVDDSLMQEYEQRNSLFDDFDIVELDQIGLLKELQYWMDEMNTSWNDWILDYNRARQRQFFQNWGFSRVTNQMLIIVMSVIVAFFVFLSGIKWFHTRSSLDPLAKALENYLTKLAEGQIIEIAPSDGPKTISLKLASVDKEKYHHHIDVLQRYIVARYGADSNKAEKQQAVEREIRQLKV